MGVLKSFLNFSTVWPFHGMGIVWKPEVEAERDLVFALCRVSDQPAASLSASPLQPKSRHSLWQSEKQAKKHNGSSHAARQSLK